jgi:hypothetical protein
MLKLDGTAMRYASCLQTNYSGLNVNFITLDEYRNRVETGETPPLPPIDVS